MFGASAEGCEEAVYLRPAGFEVKESGRNYHKDSLIAVFCKENLPESSGRRPHGFRHT